MANCSLFFTHVFRKDLYLLVLKLIIKIFLNYLFVLLSYSVVNERSAVYAAPRNLRFDLSPLPYALFFCRNAAGGLNVERDSLRSSPSPLERETLRTSQIHTESVFFFPRLRVVGSSGLEPPTSRLSAECSSQLSYGPLCLLLSGLGPSLCPHLSQTFPSAGGDEGNRTPDPLLAGQVLSQLSYTPIAGAVLQN